MNCETKSNGEYKSTNHDMFRATKLWNEVLRAFYAGIPIKKHRKYMKCYNDCFIASDAVQWLHNYLRKSPHFSTKKIQRCQALRLLQKYENSGYIENVIQPKNDKKFDDNRELFRFTEHVLEIVGENTESTKPPPNQTENALKDVSNVHISRPILLDYSRNVHLAEQTSKNTQMSSDNIGCDLWQHYSLCCGRRSTGAMTVPTNRRYIRLLSDQNQLPYSSICANIYENKLTSFNDENQCLNYDKVRTKSVRILGKPMINRQQNTQHANSSCHQNDNSVINLSKSCPQNCEIPVNLIPKSQSKSDTPPPYSLQLFLRTEWTEV